MVVGQHDQINQVLRDFPPTGGHCLSYPAHKGASPQFPAIGVRAFSLTVLTVPWDKDDNPHSISEKIQAQKNSITYWIQYPIGSHSWWAVSYDLSSPLPPAKKYAACGHEFHFQSHLGENYLEVKGIFEEGNGTPLQYSCLENPMDGEAW